MKIKGVRPNHEIILTVATALAVTHGLDKTYMSMIASVMKKHGSILYAYYPSMEELRKKILKKALEEDITEIILDAFLNKRIKKNQLSEKAREKFMVMLSDANN